MDTELVADERAGAGHGEDRQLHIGDHRTVNVPLGLLGQQEIGAAHEAHQQPDDEQVGMAHAHDMKRYQVHHELGQDIDHGGENAEDHLQREQRHGHCEKG